MYDPKPLELEPWLFLDFRGGLGAQKSLAEYLKLKTGMPAIFFSDFSGEESKEAIELESVEYLGICYWSPELKEAPTGADCLTKMSREFEPQIMDLLGKWAKMWGYGIQVNPFEIPDVRKADDNEMQRIALVPQDMLTDAQRRENTDAINKLGALEMMLAPKKWLR